MSILKYHFDVGFDWNAILWKYTIDPDSYSPLDHYRPAVGGVAETSGGLTAINLVGLENSVPVQIDLFNVTVDPPAGLFTPSSMEFKFEPANQSGAHEGPTFMRNTVPIMSESSSVAFNRASCPCWKNMGQITLPPATQPTSFRMTVQFNITGPDGTTKVFRRDPELIIGNSGA